MEGFGTELGLVNLLLLAVGAASGTILYRRIQLLLSTEWKKVLKQHNKMWASYMKDKLEEASTDDFSDLTNNE